MRITKELREFVEECSFHINRDSAIEAVKRAEEVEIEMVESFKSAAFRENITNLIERSTDLRYPESMHLQNDIEQAILNILE